MSSKRDCKRLVINGEPYVVTINAVSQALNLPHSLRITIRADYSHRSVCIIRGLTNLEYWYHYRNFDPAQTISVTPKAMTKIIELAFREGWSPRASRANFEMHLDNEGLKSLMQDA